MDMFVLCSHLYKYENILSFSFIKKQYADQNGYRDILNGYYSGG